MASTSQKSWRIKSPGGIVHSVDNLPAWCANNTHLFPEHHPDSKLTLALRAEAALRQSFHKRQPWFGWIAFSYTDQNGETADFNPFAEAFTKSKVQKMIDTHKQKRGKNYGKYLSDRGKLGSSAYWAKTSIEEQSAKIKGAWDSDKFSPITVKLASPTGKVYTATNFRRWIYNNLHRFEDTPGCVQSLSQRAYTGIFLSFKSGKKWQGWIMFAKKKNGKHIHC